MPYIKATAPGLSFVFRQLRRCHNPRRECVKLRRLLMSPQGFVKCTGPAGVCYTAATPGGGDVRGSGDYHPSCRTDEGYQLILHPFVRAALALGVPVIDISRPPAYQDGVPGDDLWTVVYGGPMVHPGRAACKPAPWSGFDYAPLPVVAALYQLAGGMVYNLPNLPELRPELFVSERLQRLVMERGGAAARIARQRAELARAADASVVQLGAL